MFLVTLGLPNQDYLTQLELFGRYSFAHELAQGFSEALLVTISLFTFSACFAS